MHISSNNGSLSISTVATKRSSGNISKLVGHVIQKPNEDEVIRRLVEKRILKAINLTKNYMPQNDMVRSEVKKQIAEIYNYDKFETSSFKAFLPDSQKNRFTIFDSIIIRARRLKNDILKHK